MANNMVSVGVALNEGPDDEHLTWPFVRNIAMQPVNQNSAEASIDQGFCCSDNNLNICRCLQQPLNGRNNHAVGIRDWISTRLLKTGFIIDDTLTMKVLIIPVQFQLPSCVLQASII